MVLVRFRGDDDDKMKMVMMRLSRSSSFMLG
jgi:hypothetical protein